MCNEVKNAIDTGLTGLCVTERDVAAIMNRARLESQPVRPAPQKQRWGLTLALAAVMLVMLVGAGVRLLAGRQDDITPLQQNEVVTTSPDADEFLPVGGATVKPDIRISAEEAVALAERHVHENCDGSVDLRDGLIYETGCQWTEQVREGNTFYANFWEVRFIAHNEYATEYTLRVKADDGRILTCEAQRGVGEWHTAQEILAGYSRVYGPDRRAWTQAQLRTYAKALRKAENGTHAWEDFLYQLCTYPDVPETAITKENIVAVVAERLSALAQEHDTAAGIAWETLETTGELRARYISAYPNAVWKIAADQTGVMTNGCPVKRTLLIEADSLTAEVLRVDAVDTLYAPWYEPFTQSVIDGQMAVATKGDGINLLDADAIRISAAYVRERWGETRDLTDPKAFRMEELETNQPIYQVDQHLRFTSTAPGEAICYELLIDWYGEVMSAYRLTLPEGFEGEPFMPTAPMLDWRAETLREAQRLAMQSPERELPEMQVFLNTRYLSGPQWDGQRGTAEDKACDALHVRSSTPRSAILIDAQPHPIWKVALPCDQGDLLVELDGETWQVLTVMRVESIYETWYLPFVLTSDLKAAGVPLTWDVQLTFPSAELEDTGARGGMRVDHLYDRFRRLYGPNMGAWTQEQLRSFQQVAVLSNDFDYDLGVPCLRHTVYPDIPEGAITRTQAMHSAISFVEQHVSLPVEEMQAEKEWRLHGGVLLGTENTPVWKVCFGYEGLGGVRCFFAEVDCMTGEMRGLKQDVPGTGVPGAVYDDGAAPANLWFREIVLEKTIEECEETWVCRGNG